MEPLMINAKDITAIVNNDLCHSCGACANVCHPEVITFHKTVSGHVFPKINYDGCTACELCSAVCPGVTFGPTMTHILEKIKDPFEGKVISAWVGQSKDKDILDNGQSGGVTSAIILNALENDIIDSAIVAVMSDDGEIHGDVILAYNKEDVLQSQRSKYIPIPLLTALSKVKERKERFAIVGLSCHIHGLHNILDRQPTLEKQLVFSVGLICDRVMVSSGMDYLISQAGVQKDRVENFYFRDKEPFGYPGYVHIKTVDKSFVLDPGERMQIKDFFTPARCRICFDKMNIGCDITIGDPHGLEKIDRHKGESLMLVRTDTGTKILESTRHSLTRLRKVSSVDAMKGQKIEEKKTNWRSYMENWIALNKPTMEYSSSIQSVTVFVKGLNEKQLLVHALSLDAFKSQKTLFASLKSLKMKRKIKSGFMLPIRMIKKIIRVVLKK